MMAMTDRRGIKMLMSSNPTLGVMIEMIADQRAVVPTVLASLSSPWWIPLLHDGAAFILPILGCILAILQIIAIIVKWAGK